MKIWSLTREDEKYSVSHSDEITCFAITADSLYVITGSRDMSLKVWQATGGKLAQVLVGHTDAVTCVAVSVTNKTQVMSGSKDTNLIIWDLHTGEEIHTLAGHLAPVIGVRVSADGMYTCAYKCSCIHLCLSFNMQALQLYRAAMIKHLLSGKRNVVWH